MGGMRWIRRARRGGVVTGGMLDILFDGECKLVKSEDRERLEGVAGAEYIEFWLRPLDRRRR